jgi:hypothetical protein
MLDDDAPKDSFWRDIYITAEECTSEKVLRMYRYWQELRGGRAMPARRDIDPVAFWSVLPNIHLSEWHDNPERVRCRLAGTEIVATLGFEIGGRWIDEYHTDPKDLEETIALFRKVKERRAPVIGRTLGAQSRLGVDSFEWILCPLGDDGGSVTHFIGLEDYVSNRRYLGAGG